MKKKLLAILLVACLTLFAAAQAQVDYALLDDMSIEDLEALSGEINARINALKAEAAESAGIFSLESAGGSITYAGFVMNDQNFKVSGSSSTVEAVVVMFNYTNKEDKEKQLQNDFWIKAYQNGTEMDTPSSWSVNDTLPAEVGNFNKSVLKGGTICAARTFIPTDDSPITVTVNAQGASANGETGSMVLDFRNTPQGKVEETASAAAEAAAEEAPAEEAPAAVEQPAEQPAAPASDLDPYQEFTDRDTIKQTQQALNDAGYNCGTPDGVAGRNTASAITAYQRDHGLKETGTVTTELLFSLGLGQIAEDAARANKYQAVLQDIRVTHNSIGSPEVYVSVKNIGTTNDIVAFTFATRCKNAYGEVLQAHNFGDTIEYWIWQEGAIKPGKATSVNDNWCWTLYGFDTAYHIDVWLTNFRTSDGVNHTIAPEDYIVLTWDAR